MSGGYGWVEFAVFLPMILGLAVWQLWSVNREIAKDKAKKSDDSAGHAVGEHPLDDR
jgi:hypothetical protein